VNKSIQDCFQGERKIFKVIINSGSINNIVSTEIVEKLELKTTAQPNYFKWTELFFQDILEEWILSNKDERGR
jgi:hypothetical protein